MSARVPAVLLVFGAVLLPACAREAGSHRFFLGEITWKSRATGSDKAAVAEFNSLSVRQVRAVFGPVRVRLDITGGLRSGVLLVDRSDRTALRLDPKKKIRERATSLEPSLGTWNKVGTVALAALPDHPPAKLLEYAVKPFRVLDPEIAPEGTSVRVWVTRDIVLPPCDFVAEFDKVRLKSPDPLVVRVGPGAVLKEEMVGDGITVTWTATKVKPGLPDPALLSVPEGYTKE